MAGGRQATIVALHSASAVTAGASAMGGEKAQASGACLPLQAGTLPVQWHGPPTQRLWGPGGGSCPKELWREMCPLGRPSPKWQRPSALRVASWNQKHESSVL